MIAPLSGRYDSSKNSEGSPPARAICRLVVLESGLGLESGLKSIFAGLGLGLGLEGSTSKSFFKSAVSPKYSSIRELLLGKMLQCTGVSKPTCKIHFCGASVSR